MVHVYIYIGISVQHTGNENNTASFAFPQTSWVVMYFVLLSLLQRNLLSSNCFLLLPNWGNNCWLLLEGAFASRISGHFNNFVAILALRHRLKATILALLARFTFYFWFSSLLLTKDVNNIYFRSACGGTFCQFTGFAGLDQLCALPAKFR